MIILGNKRLYKSVKINPENEDVWLHKAARFASSKQYSEALEASDKAIEIDPQNTDAWIYKYDYQAASIIYLEYPGKKSGHRNYFKIIC